MIKKPLFFTVNSVIFPNTSSVFEIRRDFSIAAVKEALANHQGELVIVSQKEMSTSKPGIEGIFRTGCLCEINNEIELPDGSMKFGAVAKSRFKIESLIEADSVPFAIGSLYPQNSSDKTSLPLELKEKLLQSLTALDLDLEEDEMPSLKDLTLDLSDYDFVMTFAHFLKHKTIKYRELTFDEKNAGISIFDVLTKAEVQKINNGMAAMQEILESENYLAAAQKMEKMLGD